jgi:hypothetical protein
MADLDNTHHFFRHVKKSWMDGDFIDPAAFRLRTEENGQLEEGLSINWVEYFGKSTPQEAVGPLRNILTKKGRTIGGESKFALLNVGAAKAAAAKFTQVAIITDEETDDPSHAMVTGYQRYNDQVAEELQKVIITSFPAKP